MPLTLATAVLDGVLRVAGNLILASVILYFIYDIRRQTKGAGFSTRQKAFCAGLVLVALLLAVSSYKLMSTFNDFNNMVSENNSAMKEKVLEKLQQSNDPAKKSKLTRLWAQIAYEEKGEIIEYLSPDGKSVLYQPDAESEKSRDMYSFFNVYQRMGTPISISICTVWLLTACAGTGIALRRISGANN